MPGRPSACEALIHDPSHSVVREVLNTLLLLGLKLLVHLLLERRLKAPTL